jgi:DNA-directed RNA polymerase subunit RPC12/RpoP
MRKLRKNCVDCGTHLGIISAYTNVKRCHSCNTKYLFTIGKLNQSGENHSHYKKGLPKCMDCGKQLYNYYALRCHSCCQKGELHPNLIGENNGMFGKKHTINTKIKMSLIKGGTGTPYENEKYDKGVFNENLKESIRQRDDFKCQNCGMTEEEHLIVIGRVLDVHHIDYNKENCNEDNLITACNSCNSRANVNRSYWKEFYINKINNIYFVDLAGKGVK